MLKLFRQITTIKNKRKSWLSLDCIETGLVLFYSFSPLLQYNFEACIKQLHIGVFTFLLAFVVVVNIEALVLIVCF
jgi:hypothetical protein